MSILHLALRRAAIEALCPTDGRYRTRAVDRVFDSRIDPIDTKSEPFETIVVFCEDTATDPGSASNGYPYQPKADLVLEIGATVTQAVAKDEDGNDIIESIMPTSDPTLEAAIDLMVSQAVFLLITSPHPAFRAARARVTGWKTTPFRDGDGGVKLAVRALSISCDLPRCGSVTEELRFATAVRDLLPAGEGRTVLTNAIAAMATLIQSADASVDLTGIDLSIRNVNLQAPSTDGTIELP